MPQHRLRVRQVHQNEPANNGIKLPREGHLANLADEERQVRETSGVRASLSHLEYTGIGIDAKDAALLAHQLGGKQAHISGTTPRSSTCIPGRRPASSSNRRVKG